MSVDSLAKVFSHSVGSLFALFRVSFALKKLLSLLRSHWYVLVLSVISLRGASEKMLLSFMSGSVWPMFSSRRCRVSGRLTRSLIHWELVFVSGVRECSHFILFHVVVQFSTTPFIERGCFFSFVIYYGLN